MHMSALPPSLLQYAASHRDQRNIALHLICVPLVLLALALLISPIFWTWPKWGMPFIWAFLLAITYFYTRAAGYLGLTASGFIAVIGGIGILTSQWVSLWASVFLLLAGYLLHRLGHWYEGNYRKFLPRFAFLGAAPLFVTARLMRHQTYFQHACAAIETQVGAPYLRDMANATQD